MCGDTREDFVHVSEFQADESLALLIVKHFTPTQPEYTFPEALALAQIPFPWPGKRAAGFRDTVEQQPLNGLSVLPLHQRHQTKVNKVALAGLLETAQGLGAVDGFWCKVARVLLKETIEVCRRDRLADLIGATVRSLAPPEEPVLMAKKREWCSNISTGLRVLLWARDHIHR